MSRLNTMYPDDEFLKNISDIMGKLDNKNEREIKQEIEQIGYKEFYRYYKEKDVYIKQLKEKINGVYEERTYLYNKLSAEKEQLNSLVNSCQEEIRQLKKQVENKYEKIGTLTGELLYEENTKLINQQKEFIKYLENKKISPVKSVLNSIGDKNQDYNMFKNKLDNYEEILQKYKEIIGVSDDNKTEI